MSIDLNADVGEGYDDTSILPFVTSVNIACGGHAGDTASMARTIDAALELGLRIGAHPSWPDRAHFGRLELDLPADTATAEVHRQIDALATLARARGATLSHVKPHGALYNQAARDTRLAEAVARGVLAADPRLVLVGLAGSRLLEAGRDAGLRVCGEAFVDRAYCADGSLVPRAQPGAVLTGVEAVVGQALRLARGEPIATADGGVLRIDAGTLCLHGDTPGAARMARAVREALEGAGIPVGASIGP